MFKVLLHPLALKSLNRLDGEIQRRIKDKLKELEEFPEQRGKHLRYTSFWTLRVGDYRTIYEVNKNESSVIILFVGHREDVYDDFSKLF